MLGSGTYLRLVVSVVNSTSAFRRLASRTLDCLERSLGSSSRRSLRPVLDSYSKCVGQRVFQGVGERIGQCVFNASAIASQQARALAGVEVRGTVRLEARREVLLIILRRVR